ncbi:hypothetical protein BDW59DRAFT_165310 [Aspergillus cavernicola]|uniref:F-box domain-containing protein n=1 Tax=Aspergillus cavernicola TaxID=176166 RepID=A0ABR4HTP0_9EURO
MANVQKDRSFLHLYPSIRLRIYTLAGLATNHIIPLDRRHRVEKQSVPSWKDPSRTLNLQLADLAISSALQLICRTVHDEVSHHLYSANTFIAHDMRTLCGLGPSYLASMTSLKLIPCLTSTCACTPLEFIDDHSVLDTSTQGRSILSEWHSTAGKIAPHLTGNKLDLTLLCSVQDETTAELVVAPLRRLPALSHCHIRLGHLDRRNYAIQTIATRAARQAMGQVTTEPAPPFRLLDLPREIRLLIFEYTDLLTPLNKLQWDPDHGYRLEPPFCVRDCGPPYDTCHPNSHKACGSPTAPPCHCPHDQSARRDGPPSCWICPHYACQFSSCDAQPADGENLGLSCCGARASAYSPTCQCWKPPVALFGVSRALREEAMRVFFSRNSFEVPHYRSYAYTAEATSAPEKCAAAVFLTEVVPESMLPFLSSITLSLWDCVKTTAREDWLRVAKHVVRVANFRVLTLDTGFGFDEIKDMMPRTVEGFTSESGFVALRDAIDQFAWPLDSLGTSVGRLFVDVGCTQYPLYFRVYYSYRRSDDLPVLVGYEDIIAKDSYSFMRAVEDGGGDECRWVEGVHLLEMICE